MKIINDKYELRLYTFIGIIAILFVGTILITNDQTLVASIFN